MRLIELIAALCVLTASLPTLASGLRPLYGLYRETAAVSRDLEANRFISAGFAALDDEADIAPWKDLAERLTDTEDIEVRKIAVEAGHGLFRAEWARGGQRRFVEAVFNSETLF